MPELVEKIRLQEYGVNIFTYCPTKSSLKKSIKKDRLRVNGEPASTATIIGGGEIIELIIPEDEKPRSNLEIELQVAYEDEFLAAVVKPAGIPTSGNKRRTLVNALSFNLSPSSQKDSVQPFPVHRLDYETTGLVLVGKTRSSITALSELFEKRRITKTYYAIAIGQMPGKGTIADPVRGKASISKYTVLEKVRSDRFECLNLVKLIPETGRRNQLRYHLSHMGNPILGDKKYGIEDLILYGKGLYLHAHTLEFLHPFTGVPTVISTPLPQKFSKIFKSQRVVN